MKNLLYVMAGGAIGAALRYLIGLACSRMTWTSLPMGTLTVNLIGCITSLMVDEFAKIVE